MGKGGGKPPTHFRQARGPIGIAWIEGTRLGWRWLAAFTLQDDEGFVYQLVHTSPGALKQALWATRQRQLRRHIGKESGQGSINEELVDQAMRVTKRSGRDKAIIA